MKLLQKIKKRKQQIIVWAIVLMLIGCAKDNVGDQENNIPVAAASGSKEVEIGGVARLDASGSNDMDGDEITFNWVIIDKPEGSIANIIGVGNELAEFTLDKAGAYKVELTVSDGVLESTDVLTVTNKTPIINLVDTSTSFNLPENFIQKGRSIVLYVEFLSPDITENRVSVGNQVLEIDDFYFEEKYIHAIFPEDITSGELKVSVGEQSVTWSKIMYVPSFPVEQFVEVNDHLAMQTRDRDTYFEIGTQFRPLANGKIFGFTYIPSSVGTQIITLWDNTNKTRLKQVITVGGNNTERKIRELDLFDEPINIEKNKEYTISVSASTWSSYVGEGEDDQIFPKTYDNVELVGTAFRETEPGSTVFPDDEFPMHYIVYGPDVLFAPDSQ